MKTAFKILGGSFIMLVLWLLTSVLVNNLLKVEMPDPGGNPLTSIGLMWVASLSYTLVIHFLAMSTHQSKWSLFLTVFVTFFGIQYFLSQIETFYFINQADLTDQMVWSIMVAGFFQSALYALYITRVYPTYETSYSTSLILKQPLIYRSLLLLFLVYPAIYFLAGYYIAWQSPVLRNYYQGSEELSSFIEMMNANFKSGLYWFQVMRAAIWICIGWIVVRSLHTSKTRSALVLATLFSILMGVGLILPNPFMPAEVRYFHLVELLISNFVWGFVLAWVLYGCSSFKDLSGKSSSIPRDKEERLNSVLTQ